MRNEDRQPPRSRRSLRQLRQRAHALALASYEDYLATLTEVFEARGLDEALNWSPNQTDALVPTEVDSSVD